MTSFIMPPTDNDARLDYIADLPTFVVVDVETTGLDPARHDVLEVAAIVYGPDDETGAYTVSHTHDFAPYPGSEAFRLASPDSLRINRYFERGVYKTAIGLPALDGVLNRFAEELEDVTLVGANPAFDAAFLRRLLRSTEVGSAWSPRLLDVEAMTMALRKLPRVPSLSECAALWGIPVDPVRKHTALGDAEVTLGVLQACLGHEITVAR